jgi:hypothetical protein
MYALRYELSILIARTDLQLWNTYDLCKANAISFNIYLLLYKCILSYKDEKGYTEK